MGTNVSKPSPGHRVQDLSLSCGVCGKPALIFESFISSGPMHDLVAQKVSDMVAFLAATREGVRCQQCAMKQREALEKESRYLEQQTARNEELMRQASVHSQRNSRIYGDNQKPGGSLRKSGSLRSIKGAFSKIRDFFDDEDYITDREEISDVETGRRGGSLRRQGSQRSQFRVRFNEPRRRASDDSIQESILDVHQPPPQPFIPGPNSHRPPQVQPPQAPPTSQQPSPPGFGVSLAAPQHAGTSTNLLPPPQPPQSIPPIPPASAPPNLPAPAAPPAAPPAGQPAGPPVAHGLTYDPSYTSAPAPALQRALPQVQQPPQGPPPQSQNAMSYQPPPTANVTYPETQIPGTTSSQFLSIPSNPEDRLSQLRREYEASQMRLEAVNRQRDEQERKWAEEDARRREEERLKSERDRIEREASKREQQRLRKERARADRRPSGDERPIFNLGRQSRRSRSAEEYPLKMRFLNYSLNRRSVFSGVGNLVKKALDEWSNLEASTSQPASDGTRSVSAGGGGGTIWPKNPIKPATSLGMKGFKKFVQFLEGYDLDGNLFFSLRALQSSGRSRRMVRYREKKDWASYTLAPQWQAWLRHSRDDAPTSQELLGDEERQVRIRRLAKIAEERWITQQQRPAEQLDIINSKNELDGIPGAEQQTSRKLIRSKSNHSDEKGRDQGEGPAPLKRNLPAQDPGTTFEPQQWSGTAAKRGEQAGL